MYVNLKCLLLVPRQPHRETGEKSHREEENQKKPCSCGVHVPFLYQQDDGQLLAMNIYNLASMSNDTLPEVPNPKGNVAFSNLPLLPRVQLHFENWGFWEREVTLWFWLLLLVGKQEPSPHCRVVKLCLGSRLLQGSLLHGIFLLIHSFFLLASQANSLNPVFHSSENPLSCAQEQQQKPISWWYFLLPIKHPVLFFSPLVGSYGGVCGWRCHKNIWKSQIRQHIESSFPFPQIAQMNELYFKYCIKYLHLAFESWYSCSVRAVHESSLSGAKIGTVLPLTESLVIAALR